jgi:putative glutathione S-transferase
MGMLQNGEWTTESPRDRYKEGRFQRPTTQIRDFVTADGSSGFEAEPGRYHLYISHACPWAHRTVIYRRLKKLDEVISVSVVDAFMGEMGWQFTDNPGCVRDTVNDARYMHEIYQRARPDYTGRCSVPVLWDKRTSTIVNNESSEIIRMLNSAFDAFGDASLDFYPEHLRAEIDTVNELVYENINNGVYKCGFARTQEAYEEVFEALFAALDECEARLGRTRYLVGERITEADWRLFPTLMRFDAVYVGHFKCNRQRIDDYPNLSNYLRELYQWPGVAETVHLDHIKNHYYQSHETINPTRIVPKGPELDFTGPHDRGRLAA